MTNTNTPGKVQVPSVPSTWTIEDEALLKVLLADDNTCGEPLAPETILEFFCVSTGHSIADVKEVFYDRLNKAKQTNTHTQD